MSGFNFNKTIVRADYSAPELTPYKMETEKLVSEMQSKRLHINYDDEIRSVEYAFALYSNMPTTEDTVLEIGGAQSVFPVMLATRAKQVVCVDGNGYVDREAYKKAYGLDNLLNVPKNLEDMDDSIIFDKAYSICVIEHTRDFVECQNKVRSLLKTGGLYFVSFDMMKEHWDSGTIWDHGRFFSPESCSQLITTGFELAGAPFVCDDKWDESSLMTFPIHAQKNSVGHDIHYTFGCMLLRAV